MVNKKKNKQLHPRIVQLRMFFFKTLVALKFLTEKAIIPGIIIMSALNLFGYLYGINTLLSSIALYFIVEEVKGWFKK